jgi:hypothetical protein
MLPQHCKCPASYPGASILNAHPQKIELNKSCRRRLGTRLANATSSIVVEEIFRILTVKNLIKYTVTILLL